MSNSIARVLLGSEAHFIHEADFLHAADLWFTNEADEKFKNMVKLARQRATIFVASGELKCLPVDANC